MNVWKGVSAGPETADIQQAVGATWGNTASVASSVFHHGCGLGSVTLDPYERPPGPTASCLSGQVSDMGL